MATRDKVFGGVVMLIALFLGLIYFYAIFYAAWGFYAVMLVSSFMFLIFLLIVFWVGYTIATTPSIEDIEASVRRRKK